jgi:hypothetical protein
MRTFAIVASLVCVGGLEVLFDTGARPQTVLENAKSPASTSRR